MGTYLDKTRAQRRVLALVNRAFPDRELMGLNAVSISLWQDGDDGPRSAVAKHLVDIAARLNSQAERSNERSEDFEASTSESIEASILMLGKHLQG